MITIITPRLHTEVDRDKKAVLLLLAKQSDSVRCNPDTDKRQETDVEIELEMGLHVLYLPHHLAGQKKSIKVIQATTIALSVGYMHISGSKRTKPTS